MNNYTTNIGYDCYECYIMCASIINPIHFEIIYNHYYNVSHPLYKSNIHGICTYVCGYCEHYQLLFHIIHLNSTQVVSVNVGMHVNSNK